MSNWNNAVNGNFNTARRWTPHGTPGKTQDAVLSATGAAFTVTATTDEDVNSIQTSADATLFLKGDPNVAHTFTVENGTNNGVSAGTIKVGDNTTLELYSSDFNQFYNTGTISLNAGTSNSFIDIQGASTSRGQTSFDIYGGGVILMSDNAGNGIVDTRRYPDVSIYVTNHNNTIMGAGVIGDGGFAYGAPMSFENDQQGVIDATGKNAALILDLPTVKDVTSFGTYYYGGLSNAGLIEATGEAGLNITATTVANHGTILAANGSIVRLLSATEEGGTLATAGSGVILVSGGSTIDGSTVYGAVTDSGVLQDFGEMMYAQGSITNTGAIKLSDEVTGAVMQLGAAGLTLSGGGTLTLTDNFQNGIQGDGLGSVLVNLDNKISGAGMVGGNAMGLTNAAAGVIDATGSYNALRLYGPGLTFANSGLIEATGVGGLDVAAVTLDQSGGGALTVSKGSTLNLESAYVIGGWLTNAGGGKVVASGGSSLTGTAVVNHGLFSVADADFLSSSGSITNSGTLSLAGTTNGAHLVATGELTLNGGGKVLLGNGGSMAGAAAADTITNDNTILGDGELGGLSTKFVNLAGGVIHENGTAGLQIDAAKLTNGGLIEAGGAGDISILGAVTNIGTMQANKGSMLSLVSAVTNTGVLEANGGTLIAYQAVSGAGSAVIKGGTLQAMKAFNEVVAFTGKTGALDLGKSQSYTATISGFSTIGQTSLDLGDIKFVGAGEATFSGTAAGGVLTVSDGAHSANIALAGDYLGSSFVASSDGAGGVIVKATTPATALPHAFIAAMAAMGAHAAGPIKMDDRSNAGHADMLALPRAAMSRISAA